MGRTRALGIGLICVAGVSSVAVCDFDDTKHRACDTRPIRRDSIMKLMNQLDIGGSTRNGSNWSSWSG